MLITCVRKNPKWPLKKIINETYLALVTALTARPRGAVTHIPPRPSYHTARRCDCVPRENTAFFSACRILNKAGYKSYWAARVPFLSPRHMKLRYQFARTMMDYDWQKVFNDFTGKPCSKSLAQVRFSDEKRFCVWSDGPVRVWRRSQDKFVAKNTRGTVKNKKGVMVWLCITNDGRSRLLKCDDRQDSRSYQNKILTPSLTFIRHRNPVLRNSIVFMQDGASCHTSRSTMGYLAAHRVNVMQNWPPMSPDLNPVEHCWSWLAHRLVGKCFRNTNELWQSIQSEWAQVPPDYIPNLYNSMVQRLTDVQNVRGGNTKY